MATVAPLRIGIAGIYGRMGGEVAAAALADPEVVLVGGTSRSPGAARPDRLPPGTRVTTALPDLLGAIDVLIDFTTPAATLTHARFAAGAGCPLVAGATGLDGDGLAELRRHAERIPIWYARNMSQGVAAVLALLPRLAELLRAYDVEIIETHHRHKQDAPSGTALALAEATAGGAPPLLVHGREGTAPRGPGEIGIHALRAGGNAGEHTVLFAAEGEEVRIVHRAYNRRAFAAGALRAAKLIVRRQPGWYGPDALVS